MPALAQERLQQYAEACGKKVVPHYNAAPHSLNRSQSAVCTGSHFVCFCVRRARFTQSNCNDCRNLKRGHSLVLMNGIPNPKKPQVKKTLQEVGVSSTESRDAFMNVDELRTESTGNVWEHRNVCISEGTRRARGRRGSAHYPKQTASSVKHGGDARKRKSLQVWLRYSNSPPPLMLRSFGSPTWTGGFS